MKKKSLSIILGLLALLAFSSCHDSVFQAIRVEVELGDSSVSGFINGIVRFKPEGASSDYLVTANGVIYIKDSTYRSPGGWIQLSGLGLPEEVSYSYYDSSFSGEHIFKVAADNEWLYALSYAPVYDEDSSRIVPKNLYLYACKPRVNSDGALDFISNGGWQRVANVNTAIEAYLAVVQSTTTSYYNMNASIQLFCTNAPNASHRKAFIRVGGGSPYVYNSANDNMWVVFDLNGYNSAAVMNCGTSASYEVSTDSKYSEVIVGKDVLGAVWFQDKNSSDASSLKNIVFVNYENPITNESLVSFPTPNYAYYGQGEYLWKFSKDDYNSSYTIGKPSYSTGKRTYSACEFSLIKGYLSGYGIIGESVTVDADGNETTKTVTTSISQPNTLNWTYMNTDSSICSLAVTKDYLLIGTGTYRSSGDGIYHLALDSNGCPASTEASNSDFSSNAAEVLCEPYIVRSLLAVDPDKKEIEDSIYASMDYIYTESTSGTNIEDRGLWSYHVSKLEWNRE
ncbi:MAG: hypothetical protein K6F15_03045 [Treponema sp.]|nr:hypothetical protein [Treponema sp.]